MLWREHRTDVDDKRYEAERKHKERMDNRAGAIEARHAKKAEKESAQEQEKQGLLTGYLTSKRKGNETDAETYRQELIARFQQDPAGMSDKVRFSKIEITGEDGFTKVPAILDRVTGETTPVDMAPKKEAKGKAPGLIGADSGKSGQKFFNTPAELAAAKAKGEVKSGDMVDTPQGPKRVK